MTVAVEVGRSTFAVSLLAAISVIALVVVWKSTLRRGVGSLAVGVSCILVSAGLTWIAVRLSCGRDVPSFVTRLTVLAWRALGFDATHSDDCAVIRVGKELVRCRPSMFDSGLVELLPALASYLMLSRWIDRGLAPLGRFVFGASLLLLLAIARYVMIVTLVATWQGFVASGSGAAYSLAFGCGAMASLVLLAPAFALLTTHVPSSSAHSAVTPRLAAAATVFMVSVGLLVATIRLPYVREPRLGRVLVDDSHVGDWEVAGAQYTTEWRGDMSVYACSAAFEQIGAKFHVSFNRRLELSPDVLSDVDVLVLKVPDRAFSESEVSCIDQFVRDGGGLVAIGDHTDLFGCNTALNQVTCSMGIEFQQTSVASRHGGQPGSDGTWGQGWMERAASGLQWLTGCSLKLTGTARPALVCADGFSDHVVFSNYSFFGNMTCEPDEMPGPTVQAATAYYGHGVVVALTDGTIFTNFAAFLPGNYEVLERAIEFANVAGVDSDWYSSEWSRLLAAVLCLWIGAAVWRQCQSSMFASIALVAGSTALVVAGWMAADWRSDCVISRAQSVRRCPTIAFLGVHADYHLAPTIGADRGDLNESYDTLFIECGRFGCRPAFERSYDAALRSDMIIIPNVAATFDAGELTALAAHVKNGGWLWVTAGAARQSSDGIDVVLDGLGISRETIATGVRGFAGDSTHYRVESDVSFTVSKRPPSRLAEIEYGKGKVLVCWGGDSLSRGAIGHAFDKPNARSTVGYEIIDGVLGRFASRWYATAGSRFRSGL